MTGLEVLIKEACPYMLAEWINRISNGGVFCAEYIQQLEDSCFDRSSVTSCQECWERFFGSEVK